MALYVNGKQISGGGGGGNTNSVELTYAEYQALTPEQQLDGTEYFITDVNGDGQDFQPICYSEEEREIGVWLNGKPLYEKSWYFQDSMVAIGTSWTSLGISVSSLNIEEIVNSSAQSYPSQSFPICVWNDSGTLKGIFWFNNTNIGSVTIYYTKTTDVAGSGTWTPQGVPAHHYSNDEQVVGTWIDGSTLYEKTVTYTVNKSASHTFDFTDGNVKRVVDGFIINSLNSICFPVNCSWEGKTEEFLYDETHFYIKTSANLGDSSTLRIIVQYTKSST